MKGFAPVRYAMYIIFMLGGLLMIGGTVHAQTPITGGNSFDTAVSLPAGDYTGGALAAGTPQYFIITAGQGQLITVRTAFNDSVSSYGTLSSIVLYSQDREELVNKFEANYSSITLTVSWLVDSSQASSRYYLMIDSDDEGVTSYAMTATLDNKYDAGSTVDAPSSFEGAVTLPAGTNAGHLGGGYEIGNDSTDMFVFTPTQTGSYQIRVTPPAAAQMILTVYDAQRQQVDQQYAANAGAIVTSTFSADQNSPVYVKVDCDDSCSSQLVDYSLALTTPTNTNTNTVVVNGNANTNGTVVVNTNTAGNANANTNTVVANSNTNTAATNAAATNTDKSDTKDEGMSTTTMLIIGGSVIIVILIVVIILVSRKKKGTTTPPPATPEKK